MFFYGKRYIRRFLSVYLLLVLFSAPRVVLCYNSNVDHVGFEPTNELCCQGTSFLSSLYLPLTVSKIHSISLPDSCIDSEIVSHFTRVRLSNHEFSFLPLDFISNNYGSVNFIYSLPSFSNITFRQPCHRFNSIITSLSTTILLI